MSDLDFDLSQYDEDYASAPVESRDNENAPDVKYQIIMHKIAIRCGTDPLKDQQHAHAQVTVEDHRACTHRTHDFSQQHDGFYRKHQMVENGLVCLWVGTREAL